MNPGPFKFTLQPALDAAVEERRQWEAALRQAEADLAHEREDLGKLRDSLTELEQRIAAERDNLAAPDGPPRTAEDLLAQGEYVRGLRLRRDDVRAAVARQEARVDEVAVRKGVVEDELARAATAVRQLEKVREQQLAEHGKLVKRAEQERLDEAAILRAGRKR